MFCHFVIFSKRSLVNDDRVSAENNRIVLDEPPWCINNFDLRTQYQEYVYPVRAKIRT